MPNKIEYVPVGDYLLPNITLAPIPPEKRDKPLGRYAHMQRAYLKERRTIHYTRPLLTERLFPLLWEIDEAAQTRLDAITDHETAHEIILAELFYN